MDGQRRLARNGIGLTPSRSEPPCPAERPEAASRRGVLALASGTFVGVAAPAALRAEVRP